MSCEVLPFYEACQNLWSYCRRPEAIFVDIGCNLAEFGGKIVGCAVIEEVLGAFNMPEAEDFGIRKPLGHKWVSPCGYSFEKSDTEELVIGGRDYDIGFV